LSPITVVKWLVLFGYFAALWRTKDDGLTGSLVSLAIFMIFAYLWERDREEHDFHAIVAEMDAKEEEQLRKKAENEKAQRSAERSGVRSETVSFHRANEEHAFMKAAKDGSLDVVQLLVADGININTVNDHGISVLMMAAKFGRGEVVEFLLKQHPDLSIRSEHGWTALAAAKEGGHEEIVKMMIDAGAEDES